MTRRKSTGSKSKLVATPKSNPKNDPNRLTPGTSPATSHVEQTTTPSQYHKICSLTSTVSSLLSHSITALNELASTADELPNPDIGTLVGASKLLHAQTVKVVLLSTIHTRRTPTRDEAVQALRPVFDAVSREIIPSIITALQGTCTARRSGDGGYLYVPRSIRKDLVNEMLAGLARLSQITTVLPELCVGHNLLLYSGPPPDPGFGQGERLEKIANEARVHCEIIRGIVSKIELTSTASALLDVYLNKITENRHLVEDAIQELSESSSTAEFDDFFFDDESGPETEADEKTADSEPEPKVSSTTPSVEPDVSEPGAGESRQHMDEVLKNGVNQLPAIYDSARQLLKAIGPRIVNKHIDGPAGEHLLESIIGGLVDIQNLVDELAGAFYDDNQEMMDDYMTQIALKALSVVQHLQALEPEIGPDTRPLFERIIEDHGPDVKAWRVWVERGEHEPSGEANEKK